MKQRTAVLLTAILLLGALVRIVPVNTGDHMWDETVYLQHAEIITGDSPDNFNEFAFRPPLLPLLLAGIFSITNSLIAAHLVIGLLSALAIYLTYLLGRKLYTEETGLLAAVIVAASATYIKFSHTLLIDPLLPLLWISSLLALHRYHTDPETRWLVLTGLLTGTAVLAKFTSLALLAAILALLSIQHYRDTATIPYRHTSIVAGAAALPLLPYLLWYKASFNTYLGWIGNAWTLSGGADPFLTYLWNTNALLGLPFLAGIILYAMHENLSDHEPLMLLTPSLAFLLPMQFIVVNKEPRFLLVILPFLAVMAGHGLAKTFSDNYRWFIAFAALAILPGLWYSPVTSDTVEAFKDQRLTETTYHPPFYAAQWLKDNTPPSTPVYANNEWPKLGYYSKRPIVLLEHSHGFDHHLEHTMDRSGYLYYSRNAPPHINPDRADLIGHPAFTEVAAFNDTGYLFRYEADTS